MASVVDFDFLPFLWDTILVNGSMELTNENRTPPSIYNIHNKGSALNLCDSSMSQPSYCIRILHDYDLEFQLLPSNIDHSNISIDMIKSMDHLLLIGDKFERHQNQLLSHLGQSERFMGHMRDDLMIGIVSLTAEQCNNGITHENFPSILHPVLGKHIEVLAYPYGDCELESVMHDHHKHTVRWILGPSSLHGFPSHLNPSHTPSFTDRELLLNMQTTYSIGKPSRMQAWLTAKEYCSNLLSNHRYADLDCYIYNNDLPFKIAEGIDKLLGTSLSRISLLADPARTTYLPLLQNSRYTLCPSGKNTEAYRIWESIMSGSIPIIEDMELAEIDIHPAYDIRMRCTQEDVHYLLKMLNAPVLYVKQWNGLPALLDNITEQQGIQMQQDLIVWYQKLTTHLREQLIAALLYS